MPATAAATEPLPSHPQGLADSTIRNDTNHLDLIRDKTAIS